MAIVDQSKMAMMMLEWEAVQRRADELAAEIKAAVLEIGKTQVVGNVRATFSVGRRTFDYEAAIANAIETGAIGPSDLVAWEIDNVDWFEVVQGAIQDGILPGEYLTPYTKTVIDYAAAAKALKVEAPVASQSEPSVTLKLA